MGRRSAMPSGGAADGAGRSPPVRPYTDGMGLPHARAKARYPHRPAPRHRHPHARDLPVHPQPLHRRSLRRHRGPRPRNRRATRGATGAAHGHARRSRDESQGRVHLHRRRARGPRTGNHRLGQVPRPHRQPGPARLLPLSVGRLPRQRRRVHLRILTRRLPRRREHQHHARPSSRGGVGRTPLERSRTKSSTTTTGSPSSKPTAKPCTASASGASQASAS